MVFLQGANQIGDCQVFQFAVSFQDGNALGLKRHAAVDARDDLVLQRVDGALDHGFISLRQLAGKELHRRLFPSVADHGTGPNGLVGLHSIGLEGNPGELQATLKQRLFVLPNRQLVVHLIQVDELVAQLASTCLGHGLELGLHCLLKAFPLAWQIPGQVAGDQHVVLQVV